MTTKRALLLIKVDAPVGQEKEWHKWYDTEHIPERQAIDGFILVRRFKRLDGVLKTVLPGEPEYLTICELASRNVLNSKPYLDLRNKTPSPLTAAFEKDMKNQPKFARAIYEQVFPEDEEYKLPPTRYLFVVGHEIPRHLQREYNVWYNTDHIPFLMKVPGLFATARRFKLNRKEFPPQVNEAGKLSTFLTVYDLISPEGFQHKDFPKALTPWFQWIKQFWDTKIISLYERIY